MAAERATSTDAPAARDADGIRSFEGRALGSPLRLSLRGAGWREATAAWSVVRQEFAAVDLALSRFRGDSDLTALNRMAGKGEPAPVPIRLRKALVLMERARRETTGRFDPRILIDLERLGEHGALPPGFAHASGGAGRHGPLVRMTGRGAVTIDDPVDTGGVGKGLALRWAARAACQVIPPGAGALIEAGGDIVAAGRSPIGGWLIGIEDPRRPDGPVIAVAALHHGAVATSSTRIRHWQDDRGRPVHHLIDPASGEPADGGLIAVTVADRDPAWAEIRSKSLFLAGVDRIGDEARAAGLVAWWVGRDGLVGMTPAARLASVWVDD